jgi:hypothetical protein
LDNRNLFNQIFLSFVAYDEKTTYKNVEKLQELILENISDKTTFIAEITKKFLLCSPKDGSLYQQKNILEFINSQKVLDMGELLVKILPGLASVENATKLDE